MTSKCCVFNALISIKQIGNPNTSDILTAISIFENLILDTRRSAAARKYACHFIIDCRFHFVNLLKYSRKKYESESRFNSSQIKVSC